MENEKMLCLYQLCVTWCERKRCLQKKIKKEDSFSKKIMIKLKKPINLKIIWETKFTEREINGFQLNFNFTHLENWNSIWTIQWLKFLYYYHIRRLWIKKDLMIGDGLMILGGGWIWTKRQTWNKWKYNIGLLM